MCSEFRTLLAVCGVSGMVLLSWVSDRSCCVDEPIEYSICGLNVRCWSRVRVRFEFHGPLGKTLPAAIIV
jgi:hypothetical protein